MRERDRDPNVLIAEQGGTIARNRARAGGLPSGLFKLIVRLFRADKFPSVYIIVAGGGAGRGRARERGLYGKEGTLVGNSGKSGNLNSP